MSLIRSRRNAKRVKRTKSIKRYNKRSRTRRQRGGDPEDDVLTYYNLLQKYKKAVKDTENENLPKKTEYFQKKVDDWTKKLQDLPDSERIMREYKISVLDG
jgi:hypothetical protein